MLWFYGISWSILRVWDVLYCGFQDSFWAIEKSNEPYYLNWEDFHSKQWVILEKIPSTIKNSLIITLYISEIPFGKKYLSLKLFIFQNGSMDEFKDKYGENKYFQEKINA